MFWNFEFKFNLLCSEKKRNSLNIYKLKGNWWEKRERDAKGFDCRKKIVEKLNWFCIFFPYALQLAQLLVFVTLCARLLLSPRSWSHHAIFFPLFWPFFILFQPQTISKNGPFAWRQHEEHWDITSQCHKCWCEGLAPRQPLLSTWHCAAMLAIP